MVDIVTCKHECIKFLIYELLKILLRGYLTNFVKLFVLDFKEMFDVNVL